MAKMKRPEEAHLRNLMKGDKGSRTLPSIPDWKPYIGEKYKEWNSYKTYKVHTKDNLQTIARKIRERLKVNWSWEDLALYNWGTASPEEINWYLYHFVGCRTETEDGYNLKFTDQDSPGLIYVPLVDKGPRELGAIQSEPKDTVNRHKASRLNREKVERYCWSITLMTSPCAAWSQEPTLSDEAAGKVELSDPWVSVDEMHPRDFFSKPLSDRIRWYKAKLCPYRKQLVESEQRNSVPSQLIATVILNELADITFDDQIQDLLDVNRGSVGPGQIQIDTAINRNLVDIPSSVQPEDEREYVSQRLQIMQVAIEATAREIRYILSHMAANIGKSWQASHGFKPLSHPCGPADFYQSVRGKDERDRVQLLSEMVIAAYNSPDIVIAMDPGVSILLGGDESGHYRNGRIHGFNGASIAADLYDANLFLGSTATTLEPIELVP
jgi:hypothetical protein